METLNHGTDLYNDLLERYGEHFEFQSPSFGNLLWQLIINERWKDKKPHCFVAVYNDGLVLGIAEHGETGYYNTRVHFVKGIDHNKAEDILEKLNEEMFGLLLRAQAEIVLSSMRQGKADLLFEGKDAQTVYNELGDVPVTDEMEIDQAFYHYPIGTECEQIWHEMEDHFDIVFGEMHRTDI